MRLVVICVRVEMADLLQKATKIDYRHVDNINHFIQFIREEGLPEVILVFRAYTAPHNPTEFYF
jgi:hypothetical protein